MQVQKGNRMSAILGSVFESQIFCVVAWLIVFIIALGMELATEQLVSVWFCGGAIASIILASCGVGFIPQLIVFVALSAALIAFGKLYLAKKLVKKDSKTNYDAMIEDEILITEGVAPEKNGAGKYRDVVWTVSSADVIDAGEFAVVKEIKGNKLIVSKKPNKENN